MRECVGVWGRGEGWVGLEEGWDGLLWLFALRRRCVFVFFLHGGCIDNGIVQDVL